MIPIWQSAYSGRHHLIDERHPFEIPILFGTARLSFHFMVTNRGITRKCALLSNWRGRSRVGILRSETIPNHLSEIAFQAASARLRFRPLSRKSSAYLGATSGWAVPAPETPSRFCLYPPVFHFVTANIISKATSYKNQLNVSKSV